MREAHAQQQRAAARCTHANALQRICEAALLPSIYARQASSAAALEAQKAYASQVGAAAPTPEQQAISEGNCSALQRCSAAGAWASQVREAHLAREARSRAKRVTWLAQAF